jgi:glucokinase
VERVEPLVLAIDLGGTKIMVAVVGKGGSIVAQDYSQTLAVEGPEAVMARLISAANRAVGLAGVRMRQLAGVGLAVAGVLDTRNGVVTVSPNLPGWQGLPLVEMASRNLGVSVFLVNDADAAALAEQRFGAGHGCSNLVYVTVSTGIGGGIIVDGKLYSGANGCAGEIGHMTVEPDGPKCACGNTGCLEVLASGRAIAREARRRLGTGEPSLLRDKVKGDLGQVTAEVVGEAARRGDALSMEVITRAARYLGIGLANLVQLLNPEMIIIGGGVANLKELLLRPAREEIDRRAFRLPAQTVRLVLSQLGGSAGVVGAAEFVFDKIGVNR